MNRNFIKDFMIVVLLTAIVIGCLFWRSSVSMKRDGLDITKDFEVFDTSNEDFNGKTEVDEKSSNVKVNHDNASTKRTTTNAVNNSTNTKKNNNSYSGSSNKGTSSGGSSRPATKPAHQHSWKAHYATGYKTETYYKTVYKCSHGLEFSSYGSAYQHYIEAGDRGDGCNFGPVDVPYTEQFPYQYIDYYYCSCGATK